MQLQVQLLGGLQVYRNGEALAPFPAYKAAALLAYLVLHSDRPHPRPVLASLFWGERSDAAARKCLRTELWRLRRMLAGEGGAGPFIVTNGSVGFDTRSGVWIDSVEFERRVLPCIRSEAGILTGEEHLRLQEAVDLWRGELLEGWYEDWCLYHRGRLNALYVSALTRLMKHHLAEGRWSLAVVRGCQLLQADPMLEQVHRDLMLCHWQMGNRPAALRQYGVLDRMLRDELGVEPMEETRTLCEQIRRGGRPPDPRAAAGGVEAAGHARR